MTGTVAQTIQGEAGSNPAHQFAVASVIYNRMQQGGFGGSTASQIVNAPSQFTGQATPNASAQQFAAAIENGTLPQYGNTGNAVNFVQAGTGIGGLEQGGAVNIGGNVFSDRWGAPTANFQAPQYQGSAGANFTPPPGTPDTFVTSATPGSQTEYPLNPGDYSSDPNASFTFNDPSTGAGASTSGGGGSAGGTNAQGVAAQPGAGTPIQVNLGPQTATDLQSYVTAPIKAFENWATTQFAQLGNWFTRGFLIILAIVIIMVALWKATGSPNVTEIARAA